MQSNTKDKYAEMHKKINSYIERCYITQQEKSPVNQERIHKQKIKMIYDRQNDNTYYGSGQKFKKDSSSILNCSQQIKNRNQRHTDVISGVVESKTPKKETSDYLNRYANCNRSIDDLQIQRRGKSKGPTSSNDVRFNNIISHVGSNKQCDRSQNSRSPIVSDFHLKKKKYINGDKVNKEYREMNEKKYMTGSERKSMMKVMNGQSNQNGFQQVAKQQMLVHKISNVFQGGSHAQKYQTKKKHDEMNYMNVSKEKEFRHILQHDYREKKTDSYNINDIFGKSLDKYRR